jgi:hypothetical protein
MAEQSSPDARHSGDVDGSNLGDVESIEQEVARGETGRTPFLALTGVGVAVAILFAVVFVIVFLVWLLI